MASVLIQRAVEAGHLPAAYDNIRFVKRGASGNAIHHELYDIAPDAIIVCVRSTAGSKRGVATTSKKYYLITAKPELSVTLLTITVGKLSKRAYQLGDVIRHAQGTSKISLSPPPREGYKLVRLVGDQYISVYDSSLWPLGKPRTQHVLKRHGGGFYYYRDLDHLLAAVAEKSVFHTSTPLCALAICRVKVSGRQISYANGKYAASTMTLCEQIASVCPAVFA
jgi:hypothetical protein